MTDTGKIAPLTPAQAEQRKINFFNKKLSLANTSTPKKHLKKWLKERNMAQDRLSIITQGAG